MTSKLSVVHFQRRPRESGNYSIEGVFSTVRSVLADNVDFRVHIASEFSNGLLPRYRIVREASCIQDTIVHVTGDINFAAIRLNRSASVLTCHDFGFLDKFRGLRKQLLQLFWVTLPIRRVTAVTTVSQVSKERLTSLVKNAADKITVVHNAISPEFRFTPKRFDNKNPRYLMVGTAPNKNVSRVIEALHGLPGTLRIVGVVDTTQQRLCEKFGVQMTSVHHISDAEMVAEYQAADMLLFPSTLEGFGIPIVEAQATGRAVVTSNLSSMPEIAGEGACLVDPFNVQSIRAGVCKMLNDASYRNQTIEAGKINALQYTPERMAQGYLQVYRRVHDVQARRGARP